MRCSRGDQRPAHVPHRGVHRRRLSRRRVGVRRSSRRTPPPGSRSRRSPRVTPSTSTTPSAPHGPCLRARDAGRTLARRSKARAPPLRRPDRGQPGRARDARRPRGRQADHRLSRDVDLPETVKTFRWYAEAIDKLFDAIAPTGPDALGLILREPIGVVGRRPAVELPDHDGGLEDRRRRLPPGNTRRRQAVEADLAVDHPVGRARRRRRASRTASSTWSQGSARHGRAGARPAPGRRRASRSRARPRSGACSSATRPRAT